MIKYSDEISFDKEELSSLFLSVGWNSGKYPDKLYESIKNSTYHIFAYDCDKLIGLVAGLSDKCINLFISYILVEPNYQKQGIGAKLLNKITSISKFNRIELITDKKYKKFYEENSFFEDGVGMFKINWKD